jgi:hypothetical protein
VPPGLLKYRSVLDEGSDVTVTSSLQVVVISTLPLFIITIFNYLNDTGDLTFLQSVTKM